MNYSPGLIQIQRDLLNGLLVPPSYLKSIKLRVCVSSIMTKDKCQKAALAF